LVNLVGGARALAETFWRRCAQEPWVSDDFRRLSAEGEARLASLPRNGAYVQQG
jgi:hypothetical protein